MSSPYIAVITNAGNPSAGQLAVSIPSGRVGDTILNVVVLIGTGSVPAGADVSGSFAGPVQDVPSLTNINFSGPFIIHQGATDFTGCTLLALLQRA